MKMTIHRVPISVLLKKGLALLLTLALLGPMLSMSPWLGVAAEPVGTIPESHIPEFIVPVIGRDAAPVIDGAIDEQEWSGAGRMVSVNSSRRIAETGGIFLDPRDLTFWITADDKNVYVAMKSEMPPDGRLITNLKPYDVSDTQVFQDDNVEIWFDPWRGAPEDLRTRDLRAFQMAINEDGGFFTASHTSWGGADGMWRPGWTVGSSTDSDWWYLELAIPFENLGITADNFDWSWGFHAGRGFKQPFQYTNIAPRGPAFADFTSMAVLNWEEENTPFVRHLNMRNPNGNVSPYVELELVNPTSSPYTFNVYINSNYLGDAFRGINGTEYVVPAGGKQSVIVQDGWSEGTYGTTIYITSADGSKVHFFRRMIWEIAPTDPRWELENKPAGQAFDFQFGYFPSYNTFKAEIDLRRLRLDEAYDEVTGAWVKITDKNTQEVIADEQFPAFTNPVTGVSVVEFDLGYGVKNIAAGYANRRVFEVTSGLEGTGAGVPTELVTTEFVREKFEWEGNDIGKHDDNTIYEPFTPLAVSGMDVDAVLRTHTMNDHGVWDQVVSENHNILAAPMYFEVEIDGQTQTISADALELTKAGDARVNHTASWTAGTLSAVLNGSMEMDGFTKIDMQLTQSDSAVIDSLDLVIPLNDSIATLMHTVSDYTRLNYSGDVPVGDGQIWTSFDAGKIGLSRGFLPYIWLGNEKYGLCWVAENDKDWIIDDDVPSLTMTRDNGVLELRIRFITKPSALNRERNITFALQATPTKPFPEYTDFHSDDPDAKMDWRNLVLGTNFVEGKYNVPIIGSTETWGGETTFCDVYPIDYDYRVFEIMRDLRLQGEIDMDRIADWNEIYDHHGLSEVYGYYGGKRPSTPEWYRTNVNWFINVLRMQPEGVVAYTSPRSSRENEEFRTFQDEWKRFGLTDRPFQDYWYDCSPVESYSDYSLYYLNEMISRGAVTGIYFDNTFPYTNSNTVSGKAYVDDEGNLRRGVDIFEMREHLKRVQIMCLDNGTDWLNMAHMTNTNVAPFTTWVGFNLDWEDRYNTQDMQLRFPRDYIRAQTIGAQTGSVPVVLAGDGLYSSAELEWGRRTRAGVMYVHEVKVWGMVDVDIAVSDILYGFGYGEPDCTVYRYWDDDFPVTITGADAEGLALKKGNGAVVMVTDFSGETGSYTLDITGMGLTAGGLFFNAETGASLTKNGDFDCTFELTGHDFILVEYRNAGADEQAVNEAVTAIQNAAYQTAQNDALDEAAALQTIRTVIEGLNTGTANVVNKISYTAPEVGKVGSQSGVNGEYVFAVTVSQGVAAPTTTSQLTLTVTATPYDTTQAGLDNVDIGLAKAALEAATYPLVPGRTANAEAAKAAAEAAIGQVSVPAGVTLTISGGTFTPSQPGTAENHAGIPGSYVFTVLIDKWMGHPLTTEPLTLPLSAMAYNPALDGAEESFGIAGFQVFDNKYSILAGTRIYTHTSDRAAWDQVPASHTLDTFHTVGDYDPVPLSELTMRLNAHDTTSISDNAATSSGNRLMNFLIEAQLGDTNGTTDGRGVEVFMRFPDTPPDSLILTSAFPSWGSKWDFTAYDMTTGLSAPYHQFGVRNTIVSTEGGATYGIGNTIHAAGMYSVYAPHDGGGKSNPPETYPYPELWSPKSEYDWIFDELANYEYFEMNALRFDPENKPVAAWYPVKELASTVSGNRTTYQLAGMISENRFGTVYINRLPARYGIEGSSKNINAWRPDELRGAWAGENKINISFESTAFDENDDVRLQWRSPAKTLHEITEYSIAKFGETVYMQFEHPAMAEDGIYELVFAWDGGTARQSVAIIAMDSYDIADAEKRSAFDYGAVVAETKQLLEGRNYAAAQVAVTTAEEAKEAVEDILRRMGGALNGVYVTVNEGVFTPATAGSAGNPSGVDGSYTFTLNLAMGVTAPQVTGELVLTVKATGYVDLEEFFGHSDIRVFDDKYIVLTMSGQDLSATVTLWDSVPAIPGGFQTVLDTEPEKYAAIDASDLSVKMNWSNWNYLQFLTEVVFGGTDNASDARDIEILFRFPEDPELETILHAVMGAPSWTDWGANMALDYGGYYAEYSTVRRTNPAQTDRQGGMFHSTHNSGWYSAQANSYGVHFSPPFGGSGNHLNIYESFELQILRFDPHTKPAASWYPVRDLPNTRAGNVTTHHLSEVFEQNRFGTVYINTLPERYGIGTKEINPWNPQNLRAAGIASDSIAISFTDAEFDASHSIQLQLRTPSKNLIALNDVVLSVDNGTTTVHFKHPELTEDGVYELILAWDDDTLDPQKVAILAMDSRDIAEAGTLADDKLEDDIETAKETAEAASYPAETEPMAAYTEARAAIEAVVDGLTLPEGVYATVNDVGYEPAVKGDNSNPDGTPGLYTFVVELRKGVLSAETQEMTLTIPAIPALTGTASIDNTAPIIGDQLTASLGTNNNTGTLSYQWKAGEANVGGNSNTYTVAAADFDKAITVEITSSVQGGSRVSAATDPVGKKAAPPPPAAPTLSGKTGSSITLEGDETDIYQYAYALSDNPAAIAGGWSDSPVFGGLTPETSYYFFRRVAETADTNASGASPSLMQATDAASSSCTCAGCDGACGCLTDCGDGDCAGCPVCGQEIPCTDCASCSTCGLCVCEDPECACAKCPGHSTEENPPPSEPPPSEPPPSEPPPSEPPTEPEGPEGPDEPGEESAPIELPSQTAEVSDSGVAAAEIGEDELNEAIDELLKRLEEDDDVSEIVVTVELPEDVSLEDLESLEAVLPAAALERLAEETTAGLTVKLDDIHILFDNVALEAIAAVAGEETETVTVSASLAKDAHIPEEFKDIVGDRPVYEFNVTNNGVEVSSFGQGYATVSLPYELREDDRNPNAIIVYYLDGDGKLNVVRGHYDETTGRVVIRTRHFSKFTIGYNYKIFDDVNEEHPFYNAVVFIAARGITAGINELGTLFAPEISLTRAQLLVILMKSLGYTPEEAAGYDGDNFEDAAGWYAGWIGLAKRDGITAGIGSNRFGQDNIVTHEEIFLMIFKTLEAVGETLPEHRDGKPLEDYDGSAGFSDWVYQDNNWDKIEAVLMSQIYSEDDFDPKDDLQRAVAAELIKNLLTK